MICKVLSHVTNFPDCPFQIACALSGKHTHALWTHARHLASCREEQVETKITSASFGNDLARSFRNGVHAFGLDGTLSLRIDSTIDVLKRGASPTASEPKSRE